MRGVAGAKVYPGEEDGEEGSSGNRVPKDPPSSVHPQQLPDGPRRGDLSGRGQGPDPERSARRVRAPARGKLSCRSRSRAKVNKPSGKVNKQNIFFTLSRFVYTRNRANNNNNNNKNSRENCPNEMQQKLKLNLPENVLRFSS